MDVGKPLGDVRRAVRSRLQACLASLVEKIRWQQVRGSGRESAQSAWGVGLRGRLSGRSWITISFGLGDFVPIKWKPMIWSIPYVLAVLVVKLVLHKLDQPGVLEFSDLGIVYTGGVFLLGFNLAGTMADYKESERIPGELACIFETLEDSLRQAAKLKPELDLHRCRQLHAEVLDAVIDWLLRKEGQPAVFDDVSSAMEVAHALDRAGTPAIAGRYVSELHNIRKGITRIGVISRTVALESGFAFLQFMTVAIILLLLISRFRHPLSEAILVSFVSLIYIYLLRLIKDIDDPFEYSTDGRRRGCAEVDLFPLLEYQQRLKARLTPSAPVASSIALHVPGEHSSDDHSTASRERPQDPADPTDHNNIASTNNAIARSEEATDSSDKVESVQSGSHERSTEGVH